jgi:demethylspheroidene O-methyltransferase
MFAFLENAFYAWRNRLAVDPRFQRFAARFPLTRPLARREAAGLFDLVSGFVYTQILFAVVELEILPDLAKAPASEAEIAARTGLPAASAEILLKAAATLGLVHCLSDGRYTLGLKGASLLGNPSVMDLVKHHRLLYADLSDPVALLRDPARETELSAFWAYARTGAPADLSADTVTPYSALMASTQALVRDEILDSYDLSDHTKLLDLGGGLGAFALAAAARAPNLAIRLFDLPPVAAEAQRRFDQAGLGNRAKAFGGDFHRDTPPETADLVTLVRVLYDHQDEAALTILRRAKAALAPGGTLLIGEPMAAIPGAERMGYPYFGLYLLAMHGGRIRTGPELADLCRRAGFSHAAPLPARRPLMTGLVTASVK